MQDHYNSEEKDEENSLGNSPTISKEFDIANQARNTFAKNYRMYE